MRQWETLRLTMTESVSAFGDSKAFSNIFFSKFGFHQPPTS